MATEAQSPQVFEISGTAGKACVTKLGLQSAAVCRCCRLLAVPPGTALAVAHTRAKLMVLQSEPSPV